MSSVRVIAGDVGGTSTRLALCERSTQGEPGAERPIRIISQRRYASADASGLEPLVARFLRSLAEEEGSELLRDPVQLACFAVAGPVRSGSARLSNLPWELDEGALAASLSLRRVVLINDFVAVGHGIGPLPDSLRVVLQDAPVDPAGPVAYLGAGTGLGQGYLVPGSAGPRVFPSEGGHTDFAPLDAEQRELQRWLEGRHGRVSYERIVSGPGLVDVWRWLVDQGGDPEPVRNEGKEQGLAAAITELGVAGGCPVAARAIDHFVRIYGAEAGNLALKLLPTGGLYVAGGIAPKMLPRLQRGDFMAAFRDKGRFASLLERIPVSVITDPDIGVRGAAAVALHAAEA